MLAVLLCPATAFAQWTATGGGDHGGADWAPANGTQISGVHTNIGTFSIPSGSRIYVQPRSGTSFGSVTIEANTAINIAGALDGNARGFPGGAGGRDNTTVNNGDPESGYGGAAGTGTGAGTGGTDGQDSGGLNWRGGGGGGAAASYGGAGGAGGRGGNGASDDACPANAGAGGGAGGVFGAANDELTAIGAGGGGGGSGGEANCCDAVSVGATGGAGGAEIRLIAPYGTITISGSVTSDGGAGGAGAAGVGCSACAGCTQGGGGGGGGGAAGGGILVKGVNVVLNSGAVVSARGGVGGRGGNGGSGANYPGAPGSGGAGGGGGRVKISTRNLSKPSGWTAVVGGGAGGAPGTTCVNCCSNGGCDNVAGTTGPTGGTGSYAELTCTTCNQLPTVSSTSPASGTWLRTSAVTLSAVVASGETGEAVHGEFSIDGAAFVDGSSVTTSGTSSYSTTLADGSHTWVVRAQDGIGQRGSTTAAQTIRVDTVAPAASRPTASPSPNRTGTHTVSWTASDATSGLASIVVRRSDNGSAFSTVATLAGSATSWTQSPALAQGSYRYQVVATDVAGNATTSASSLDVVVDTTAPTSPGAPAGTPNPTSTTATISWAASTDTGGAGLASYELQHSSDNGATWTATTTTTGTSFVHTPPEGSVRYRVRALDAVGNASAFSTGTIALIVDRTGPAAAGTPSASPNPSADTATVTWAAATDGGAGIGAYELQRSANAGSTWTAVYAGAARTFLDDPPQGAFVYRARAIDGAGNAGAWSASSATLVVDETAPTVPGTPSIAPNPSRASITISWSASTDSGGTGLSSYRLERSSNGGSTWTAVISQPTTSHTESPGQGAYLYRVRAADAVGNLSAWSANSASAVIDTTAPSAPGAPAASPNPANASVTVAWAASSDTGGSNFASYELQRSPDSGATWATVASPSAATHTESPAEGRYLYRVRATDKAGNSSAYTVATVALVVDKTAPTAPGTPAAAPNPSAGTATISWSAATDSGGSGLASYELQRSANAGSTWAAVYTGAARTFPDDPPQGAFVYRARALDAAGNAGAWSAASSALVVDESAPSAPGTPSISPNPSRAAITITWSASTDGGGSGLTGYQLERSGNGGSTWTTVSSQAGTSHTESPGQGSYLYRVRATDAAGNLSAYSGTSAPAVIDTTAPSVPGLPFASPNPTGGSATVTWAASTDGGGAGLAGYELERSADDGSTWAAIASPSGITQDDAPGEGRFLYRVRAVDAAGNRSAFATGIVSLIVDETAPAVPGVPVASPNPSSDIATITWTEATDGGGAGVAAYHLERSSDGGATWVLLHNGPESTYSDDPIEGSYLYRVQAVDAAGNPSGFSSSSAALIVDETAPSQPGRPLATPNPSRASVSVNWAASTDSGGAGLASYTLERSSDSGATWTPVTTQSATTWDDSPGEGVYLYRVQAADAAGNRSLHSSSSSAVIVDETAPATPGLPSASPNPTNGSATLTWSASTDSGGSGLSSYEVERSADGGATWLAIGTPASESLTDAPAEGSYTYRVRALDAAGNVSAFAVSSTALLIDMTAPAVPGTPSASPNPSAGQATITWAASSDASSGVASYQLQRSADGATWTTVSTSAAATFSDSPGEGSWVYRVQALDAAGNASGYSAASQPLIVDETAPEAPGAPSAAVNPTNGEVALSWAASSDTGGAGTAGYELERSADGGTTWQAVSTPATTAHTESPGEGRYHYRVRARDAAGNLSGWSANSAAIVVDETAPGAPGKPAPSPNPTAAGATIAWADAVDTGGAGVARYELERSSDGGTSWTQIASTASTSFLDSPAEGLHTYRVRAIDAADNVSVYSAASDTLRVDKTPPANPGAPIASPNPTGGSAVITWSASSDPDGSGVADYELERSSDGGATWTVIATVTAATFTDDPAEGTHLYRVRARDAAGNLSGFSTATGELLVDRTAPEAPGTPSGSPNPTNGQLTVSWTASTDAGGSNLTGYELEVSEDGGSSWTLLASVTGESHGYAPAEGKYQFRVRALDAAENASAYSAASAEVIVDLTAPTTPGAPRATPNPGSGAHTVTWAAATDAGGSGIANYELYRRDEGSTTWTLVSTQTALTFDAQLATGTYYYRVRALDAAGNEGGYSLQTAPVRIDTAASVLAFTTLPQTLVAGQPSAAIRVQSRNSLGVAIPVTADLTVSIRSSSVEGGFDATAGGPFAPSPFTLTIPSGSSDAELFYMDTLAGAHELAASASGYSDAVQTITVEAAAVAKLAFLTETTTLVAGKASPEIRVAVVDTFGNPSVPAAPVEVALATSTAAGAFDLSATGAFDGTVKTVTITPPSAEATLYYVDPDVGTATLTLTEAALGTASQDYTITADQADHVVAAAEIAAARIGGETSVSVQVTDLLGNPVKGEVAITVTASGGARFTATSLTGATTGTGSIAGTTDADGKAQATLTSDAGGVVTVTPSSAALPAAAPHVEAQVSFAAAPVVSFWADPTVGRAPLEVKFDGRDTTPGASATLDQFRWSFGDGNALSGGDTATHLYLVPGSFRPRLKVVDNFGSSSEAEALIVVQDAQGNFPPVARIVASATTGTDSLEVELSCDCKPGSAPVAAWEWDVAGALARTETTKLTLAPGRHRVRLTVTDGNGLTGRDELWITVNQGEKVPPECAAFGSPAIAPAPVSVDYSATYQQGSAGIAKFGWLMANGELLEGKDAFSNQYDAPGEYRTRFDVEDADGLRCSDTHLAMVLTANGGVAPSIVTEPALTAACRAPYEYGNGGPVARGTGPFTWSVAEGPAGLSVDASTGALSWTPGDTQGGEQKVVLKVESESGAAVQEFSVTVSCDVPGAGLETGCGCGTGAGAGLLPWLAIFGLGMLRRRRK